MRFTHPDHALHEAMQCLDRQQYQQACLLLQDYLGPQAPSSESVSYHKAVYLRHLCALRMGKAHADDELREFIRTTPFQTFRQLGAFELGHYYYERQHFDAAIRFYEQSSIDVLSNEQLTRRNFELGYAYLVSQQLDKVDQYFKTASNIPGEYAKPGTYYHGLLAYYKKNYPEARKSFEAIKNEDRYRQIVPFYLTEIDYLSGNKQQALQAALDYLKAPERLYYYHELNQMIAQVYCEKDSFAKAEPYYAAFIAQAPAVRPVDYFKLGYCQYQQGKSEEAIANFELALKEESNIKPYALYVMALASLETGNKNKAYELLAQYAALPGMKEDEAVTFALASLSMDLGEYTRATTELNAFLQHDPTAEKKDQALEWLARLYIRDDRFVDAVRSMNAMGNLPMAVKRLYQKANYAKGIQLLINENAEQAIPFFREAADYAIDQNLSPLSRFWLTECYYRLGRYSEAMTASDAFLQQADTLALAEYTHNLHLTRAFVYRHTGDTLAVKDEYQLAIGEAVLGNVDSLMGSVKINVTPDKAPTVELELEPIRVQLPELAIDFSYKPVPLKPLALKLDVVNEDRCNYLGLLAGNLATLQVEGAYNADSLAGFPLYTDLSYVRSNGRIANQDVSRLQLSASSSQEVLDHRIGWKAMFDRQTQYQYGYNRNDYVHTREHLRRAYQYIGAQAAIQPEKTNREEIVYHADVATGYYRGENGAGEFGFRVSAPAGKELREDLHLEAEVVADLNVYHNSLGTTWTNSMLAIKPSLTKTFDRFWVKAGLYPVAARRMWLFPEIRFNYTLPGLKSEVELSWENTLRLNTYKQLTTLNPFMQTDYAIHQSVVTEYAAGIKGSLLRNVSYSLRSGLGILRELPVFINDTSSDGRQFRVLYEERALAFLLDASFEYTLHAGLLAGAHLNARPILGRQTYTETWHYVPYQFDLYARYRVNRQWQLSAYLMAMAGIRALDKATALRPATTRRLPAGFDMNLTATYAITKDWNARLDLNNLFNSKYQRWNQYPMYGINAMAGVYYTFGNRPGRRK